MNQNPTVMDHIRVFVADDHELVVDGIRAMLNGERNFVVVGSAKNGLEVISALNDTRPDVILMDINMPHMDGIETTRELKVTHPHIHVVALSMYNNMEFIDNLLDAGASGYLLKNTGKEELMEAIRQVLDGKRYLGKEVQQVKNEGYKKKERNGTDHFETLTKREKEIIRLITRERTTQEIAEELHISPATVETHRKNILNKLDVRNIAGLVKYALERGSN
jgi:two-component system, NarL family, nitrate/nitrite response regulator NarL